MPETTVRVTYENENKHTVRYVDDFGIESIFGRGIYLARDYLPHPFPRVLWITISDTNPAQEQA